MSDVDTLCGSIKWDQVKCNISQRSPYNIDVINRNFLITSNYSVDKEPVVTWVLEKAKGLNKCQKAVLLKCVTASYLRYDKNENAPERMSLSEIIEGEKGRCAQFSSLYKWLSDKVGITSFVATGDDDNYTLHAWNIVKIGSRWFYLEPQSGDNLFFEVQSGSYVLNKDLSVGPGNYIFP